MGLLSRTKHDPSLRMIALALAAGIPLAAYLATLSTHAYWLDGGEFAAQAVNLDIVHPPGHPLTGLLGKLATLIPLGPIPMRVALAQALCASAAAAFFFSALETSLRVLGVQDERLATPLALGGTFLVSTSYAFWFQAVRPEVYALQALLVMVAVERLIALEARAPTLDLRPLYTASLALGLGLANHHLVAFLALPIFAPTLARVYRARGKKPLLVSASMLALGLMAYGYLPLRAHAAPLANLGAPTTLARLYWVVSAQIYTHDLGLEAAQPLTERFVDVAVILGRNLANLWPQGDPLDLALQSALALGVAALGLYGILRTQGAWRIGLIWALLWVVNLGGRAWLGSVRSNPDVLGYMMPGIAAMGALITIFFGLVLVRLGQGADGRARKSAILLAILLALGGLAQARHNAERASLANFHDVDSFDDLRIRRLPQNAVVLVQRPQTVFRHWALIAEEGARPDVTLVPMPFLNYPGMVDALMTRDPELRHLLRGYLLSGELRQPDMQSLATQRPLLLELDSTTPEALYETLVPAGLYYEVYDAGATDTDVREAAIPHRASLRALRARLGSDMDRESRNHLLFSHYMDALYFSSMGIRPAARESTEAGLALEPLAHQLQALDQALQDPDAQGPLDISPYVLGAPIPDESSP